MKATLKEEQVTLITGCYGFIGTHLVRKWLENSNHHIVGMDVLTYAAQPKYLMNFLKENPEYGKRFSNVMGDIRDQAAVSQVMRLYKVNNVVNLAAESHVCRSISGPRTFFETNVMGTFNLIEELLHVPLAQRGRFLQVSTDEVFGELPIDKPEAKFTQLSPLAPRSPYAASKAGAEHVVQCYNHTYAMDTVITNCSNNFGRFQHWEKLIPKTVKAIIEGEPITIYGDGEQVRDWISVENHCNGLLEAFEKAPRGARVLLGGEWEMSVKKVIELVKLFMKKPSHPTKYTFDRPSDDRRYAIDTSSAKELGWIPLDGYERIEALRTAVIALEEEFKRG